MSTMLILVYVASSSLRAGRLVVPELFCYPANRVVKKASKK